MDNPKAREEFEQAQKEATEKFERERAEKWAIDDKRNKQQNQFQEMISKIESGEVEPNAFMDWENVEGKTPEEIALMPKDEFRFLFERTNLANELKKARLKKQREKAESLVVDKIIKERESKKRKDSLTKEETKKYWGEMGRFYREE